jgi:hypothetical protein
MTTAVARSIDLKATSSCEIREAAVTVTIPTLAAIAKRVPP